MDVLESTRVALEGFPPCVISRPATGWTAMHSRMSSFAFYGHPSALSAVKTRNVRLVEQVQELLNQARQNLDPNDQFRQKNYPRVVAFLSRAKEITTPGDLEREIADAKFNHGIGGKTKEKLLEILQVGTTARLQVRANSSFVEACADLQRIWGVGPATAQKLASPPYSFLSVEDFRERFSACNPPPVSGDSLYCLGILEELETRIPRGEVEEIVAAVREVVDEEWGVGKVRLYCCGSYRRGVKKDCGDVDVLMSHVDERFPLHVDSVVGLLKRKGIVTRVLKSPVDNDKRDTEKSRKRDPSGGGRNDDSESEGSTAARYVE